MNVADKFIARAQENPARIVYPEATDPRILKAVVQVKELGIAHPLLVGNPEQIQMVAEEHGCAINGIELIDSKTDARLDSYAQAYADNRDLREAIARKLVCKPLSFGGMMLGQGWWQVWLQLPASSFKPQH